MLCPVIFENSTDGIQFTLKEEMHTKGDAHKEIMDTIQTVDCFLILNAFF